MVSLLDRGETKQKRHMYLYLCASDEEPPFDAFFVASASEADASDASETSDGVLVITLAGLLWAGLGVLVLRAW